MIKSLKTYFKIRNTFLETGSYPSMTSLTKNFNAKYMSVIQRHIKTLVKNEFLIRTGYGKWKINWENIIETNIKQNE